jgi:hypothetical protein
MMGGSGSIPLTNGSGSGTLKERLTNELVEIGGGRGGRGDRQPASQETKAEERERERKGM